MPSYTTLAITDVFGAWRTKINDAIAYLNTLDPASNAEVTAGSNSVKYVTPTTLKSGIFITRGELSKSTAYTLLTTDRNYVVVNTGAAWSLTLPAASTSGMGFVFGVRNAGTGVLTIDPNASETIDGSTTLGIQVGESCIVYCNGTSWFTIGKSIQATNADTITPAITAAETRANDFAIAMAIALS